MRRAPEAATTRSHESLRPQPPAPPTVTTALSVWRAAALLGVAFLIVGAHAARAGCVGDCDGSGAVTVNEIVTLVNIDLGTAAASACSHGIPSGVTVDITVIIQAVNVALDGCALSPAEQGCLNSGGTVASAMCCAGTGDFPDRCSIGACGCSPDASHEVRVCHCGAGNCFNGSECVSP